MCLNQAWILNRFGRACRTEVRTQPGGSFLICRNLDSLLDAARCRAWGQRRLEVRASPPGATTEVQRQDDNRMSLSPLQSTSPGQEAGGGGGRGAVKGLLALLSYPLGA